MSDKRFLVMPVYNEGLPAIIAELEKWKDCDIKGVLIVWKGVLDDTVVTFLQDHSPIKPIVVRKQTLAFPGLAGAYEQCITEAAQIFTWMDDEDYIVTIDCGSWNPLDLMHAFAIYPGRTAYVGIRRDEYARTEGFRVRNAYRRWLSGIGSKIIAWKTGLTDTMDYTCGYRAYRLRLLKEIDITGRDVPNRLYHAKLAVELGKKYGVYDIWKEGVTTFFCDPQSDDVATALNLTDTIKSLVYVLKGGLTPSNEV